MVNDKLHQVNKYYEGVYIDYSIIMPDHIHAIFVLHNAKTSLSKVINVLKSWVTRNIKENSASQGDAATIKEIINIV